MEEYDTERLRRDLIGYIREIGQSEMDNYGAAMSFFPMATVDLIQAETNMDNQIAQVSSASDDELKNIAESIGVNLDDYKRGMRF